MGLTNFPNGIFATPNIGGAGRLMDLWNSNNIYFVDGKNGSAGNPGKNPETAHALPSESISACFGGASIYIRPAGVLNDQTTSQEAYYTDDIIIPYTKGGIALIGAGEPQPYVYGGVALRPSTVTGSLIDVRSNSNVIENMHLTLNGGTVDQADGSTTWQCIVLLHRDGSNSRPYGNVIRGCRFSECMSHPTAATGGGAIVNFTAQKLIVENNIFEGCLGGVLSVSHAGDANSTYIRNNVFGGNPANRDVDVAIVINSAGADLHIVHNNLFSDGIPAHSNGDTLRFIAMDSAYDAGTGLIAGNYFATTTNTFKEGTAGAIGMVNAEMFMAGNFIEGDAATAPYGILTRAA